MSLQLTSRTIQLKYGLPSPPHELYVSLQYCVHIRGV